MNCYDDFADFYNELMDCDYDKWSQFLVNHGCRGSGADLACGTGNITFRLAAAGCSVIGVDASPRMLTVAEGKKKNVSNPLFRCQNMTEFEVTRPLDFVTCVCDGVNYLVSPADAAGMFGRVYASLKEGGVFIFDISSEYKLRHVLAGNFFYDDGDDVTYLWTNTLKKGVVIMDLTFFAKKSDGSYRRFDERHEQRVYGEKEIVRMLSEAGFSDIRMFDYYTDKPVSAETQRVVFTARK